MIQNLSLKIYMVCAIVLMSALVSRPTFAQSDTDLGESAQAVHELAEVKNKVLIFVFDVSGSMRGKELTRAREATLNMVREATGTGDRVVLFTFGANYKKVFDTTLHDPSDKDTIIEKVPSQVESGEGTNIRRPHHEALKILEKELPRPGAVILLTDSYNDEPKQNDTAYTDYIKYYTPGGRLKKYPDTPENRDYERLLTKINRSQKVKFYGFGVQIDQNTGRPVEQLPSAEPQPVETAPADTTPAPPPVPKTDLTWVYLLIGAGAVVGVALLLTTLSKPVSIRIATSTLGKKNFQDYQIKGGQNIRIGGVSAGFDGYPVPGTTNAVAIIKAARGQIILAPAPPQPGSGVESQSVRVFHNGVPLEKESPMRYGDEVRINIPDPSGVARDVRLHIEDPKKTY